jgi:imidazoleglycerol-phosphate dehydratase
MDESLARACVDLSGRGFFAGEIPLAPLRIGGVDGAVFVEFFKAAASAGGFSLHLDILRGENGHHIVEAAFKALARALRQAAAVTDDASSQIPSTKGTL